MLYGHTSIINMRAMTALLNRGDRRCSRYYPQIVASSKSGLVQCTFIVHHLNVLTNTQHIPSGSGKS